MHSFIASQYCYNYLVNQISIGLLIYSHLPVAIAGLFLGGFLLFRARRLPNVLLFFVSLCFAIWCLLDLGSWFAFLGSGVMMTTWSVADLFAPLFFFFSYYLLYALVTEQDLPLWQKGAGIALIMPIAIWVLLGEKLELYDGNSCEAYENTFRNNYQFLVEGIFLLSIIVLAIYLYRTAKDSENKKKIILASTGIVIFLGFFLSSTLGVNFLVSDTAVQFAYNFEIYGLFGMPVLLGFLAYLIVKFHAFNIKVFGAQILVVAMVILVGSEFFFIQDNAVRILTAVTLFLVSFFGYILVRSVRSEISEREELALSASSLTKANVQLKQLDQQLEKQNLQLKEIDQQKTDFLSIASHQLRTPLTVLNGYIELIKDGGYGKVTAETKEILDNMDSSNGHLIKLVDEFLDITRLDQGRTKYAFKPVDLTEMVDGVVKEQSNRAAQKRLKLIWKKPKTHIKADVDDEKIRHVIYNFVDNAIKYCPTGSVTVSIDKEGDQVFFRVKDTGIGFGKSDEANFFQKFYRGENVKTIDVTGTGLGLYVCHKFIEAHQGQIWAHSPGLGKGDEFGFSIPIKKS